MPEIDVTEVLLGSDIAGESFTVIRRQQTTGTDGLTRVLAPVTVPGCRGSITPVGDNSLIREEAYTAQHKAIMVISTFLLRGSSRTIDGVQWSPDLVLWKGSYYIVRTVEDYSQYGVGMVQADCETFDYVPPPPTVHV